MFMKHILWLVSDHTKTITSTQPNISSLMFQHWQTMHLMLTMWSIGRSLQFWTENRTQVLEAVNIRRGMTILELGREELNKLLLTNVSGREQKVEVKCWLCW